MTKMLACVSQAEEAEAAIHAGADILEMRSESSGFAALPLDVVRQTAGVVAQRTVTIAVCGARGKPPEDVAQAAEALAETGVDRIAAGFFDPGAINSQAEALSSLAGRMHIGAILFADLKPDLTQLDVFAQNGFGSISLDVSHSSVGRILDYFSPAAVGDFFACAKALGLQVGVSGGLEAPDVPRLLHFAPDFLGFRDHLAKIRELIPSNEPLLTATSLGIDKIFVRDFVLPVEIGAYSFEHGRTQKVRFDVVAEIARQNVRAQDMRHVVSYDLIMDGIRAIVASGHVQMSEALAEEIADHVLKSPRVVRVTVRVEKLELGAGGVGVEIEREAPRHN